MHLGTLADAGHGRLRCGGRGALGDARPIDLLTHLPSDSGTHSNHVEVVTKIGNVSSPRITPSALQLPVYPWKYFS